MNLIKFFGKVKTVYSFAKWVNLFVDTIKFFHDQAIERDLVPSEGKTE